MRRRIQDNEGKIIREPSFVEPDETTDDEASYRGSEERYSVELDLPEKTRKGERSVCFPPSHVIMHYA